MKWRPLSQKPKKTGRYIVKHRGNVGGAAWFTANEEDCEAPLGWSQLTKFGATHWLEEGRAGNIGPRMLPF